MIGVDVAKISRFEKHVENGRFHRKILTQHELQLFLRRKTAESLASFFAVKEASSKALGTGIGRIGWRDIELRHSPLGQPRAVIYDRKNGRLHKVAVSLTHDAGIVVATAMLAGQMAMEDQKTLQALRAMLKKRPPDMHKGAAGRGCVIGGSPGMTGSITLAAQAVLRAGAGYCFAMVPDSVLQAVQMHLVEPIVLRLDFSDPGAVIERTDAMDAVGIGPGLGTGQAVRILLEQLVQRPGCPVVIDADALTVLASDPDLLLQKARPLILTPHRKELERLLQAADADTPEDFVRMYDIILIEKGSRTKIHAAQTYVNPTGNPGLATAGTGDVLTGVLTGLLARGYDSDQAARLGTWVHGAAGNLAKLELGEEGIIASDLLLRVAVAMKRLKEDEDEFWEHMGRD